jgi:hypothetical protein
MGQTAKRKKKKEKDKSREARFIQNSPSRQPIDNTRSNEHGFGSFLKTMGKIFAPFLAPARCHTASEQEQELEDENERHEL